MPEPIIKVNMMSTDSPFVRCDQEGRVLGICTKCGAEMFAGPLDLAALPEPDLVAIRGRYTQYRMLEEAGRPGATSHAFAGAVDDVATLLLLVGKLSNLLSEAQAFAVKCSEECERPRGWKATPDALAYVEGTAHNISKAPSATGHNK